MCNIFAIKGCAISLSAIIAFDFLQRQDTIARKAMSSLISFLGIFLVAMAWQDSNTLPQGICPTPCHCPPPWECCPSKKMCVPEGTCPCSKHKGEGCEPGRICCKGTCRKPSHEDCPCTGTTGKDLLFLCLLLQSIGQRVNHHFCSYM